MKASILVDDLPVRDDGYYLTLEENDLYVDLGNISMPGLYRIENGEIFILADLPWNNSGWNRYSPQVRLVKGVDPGALRAVHPGEAAMILFQSNRVKSNLVMQQ